MQPHDGWKEVWYRQRWRCRKVKCRRIQSWKDGRCSRPGTMKEEPFVSGGRWLRELERRRPPLRGFAVWSVGLYGREGFSRLPEWERGRVLEINARWATCNKYSCAGRRVRHTPTAPLPKMEAHPLRRQRTARWPAGAPPNPYVLPEQRPAGIEWWEFAADFSTATSLLIVVRHIE